MEPAQAPPQEMNTDSSFIDDEAVGTSLSLPLRSWGLSSARTQDLLGSRSPAPPARPVLHAELDRVVVPWGLSAVWRTRAVSFQRSVGLLLQTALLAL